MDVLAIITNGIVAALGVTGAAYALSAIGLNLQFGYAGLINFGHVAFMLVGAYGFAVTADTGVHTGFAIIVGLAAAAALALVIGMPTLRLRGDYLAIVTIAAAEILRLLANSRWLAPLTNGPRGIQSAGQDLVRTGVEPRGIGFPSWVPLIGDKSLGIPDGRYGPSWTLPSWVPGIGGDQFVVQFTARQLWLMLIAWGLVALALLMVYRLMNSPWGRVIRAIRDDEEAVRSVGKNVYAYKQQALVVGGMLGGLAGIVLTLDRQNVVPADFQPLITFYVYVIVILGGAGTVLGPLFGALSFWFLLRAFETFLSQAEAEGWFGTVITSVDIGPVRWLMVGLGLMLLMLFRPQGLVGSRSEQMIDAR